MIAKKKGTWKKEESIFLQLSTAPLLNQNYQFDQGLLDLDGRNSRKYLHQTWAYF